MADLDASNRPRVAQRKVARLFRIGHHLPVPALDNLRAFGDRLPSIVRHGLVAIACLLPIALIIHAVTFWGRGIIDSEAMEFVLNYLQHRPFFAQIFDPQINDWGAYQARELSYVFDFIDARVFAALLDRQVLIFFPLSGVLGLIAVSAAYFGGARKVFRLNVVTTCLLLSLFLSCIVVQASTPILYRSSKIILSVAMLGFFFYLFALFKIEKRQVTPLKGVVLFSVGLAMALCDRQGFYYLISATGIVAMLWLIAKRRNVSTERAYLRVIVANTAAIVATIFYNRIFTPWLVHSLNGYWPNFTYQNLPWSKLLDPALLPKSLHIFCDQISFFFGNIPFFVLGPIVVIGAAGCWWRRRSLINLDNLTIVAVSMLTILAVIGLLAAMIARHPAVYNVRDHEFWYYTLSVHVVILFGISAWLSFFSPEQRSRFAPLVHLAALIVIVLNVSAYGRQREIMIHSPGWFDGQYAHSRALVEQFATTPPDRGKLLTHSSDLFWDDQAHFLENVELSYLHLTGAIQTEPAPRP